MESEGSSLYPQEVTIEQRPEPSTLKDTEIFTTALLTYTLLFISDYFTLFLRISLDKKQQF